MDGLASLAVMHPKIVAARSAFVLPSKTTWLVALSCTALAATGCPSKTKTITDGGSEPSANGASPIALADASADGGSASGEDVAPVYPVEPNAPVVALAEKLCRGLTTMPETKRSACCKTAPAIVVTNECTRMLSAAISHNAITLAEADVDACVGAYERTLEGCDWVGPFPPPPPPACQGLLHGRLASGAKCRSSLECSGALRCIGLGPTSVGTCGAAGSTGTSCGGAVDTLASVTRQVDVARQHPDCAERCIKHKCATPLGAGAACQISADCQDGLQCLAAPNDKRLGAPRTCVQSDAGAKEGDACPGGQCAGGLQCIRGKCMERKPTGEACTDDFECRGGCLKDAGRAGTCGPRCDIR